MSLPEVKYELFDGLIASDGSFDIDEYLLHVLDQNPNVFALLSTIEKQHGRKALGCAVLVYRMLEAQAECDELWDNHAA